MIPTEYNSDEYKKHRAAVTNYVNCSLSKHSKLIHSKLSAEANNYLDFSSEDKKWPGFPSPIKDYYHTRN